MISKKQKLRQEFQDQTSSLGDYLAKKINSSDVLFFAWLEQNGDSSLEIHADTNDRAKFLDVVSELRENFKDTRIKSAFHPKDSNDAVITLIGQADKLVAGVQKCQL